MAFAVEDQHLIGQRLDQRAQPQLRAVALAAALLELIEHVVEAPVQHRDLVGALVALARSQLALCADALHRRGQPRQRAGDHQLQSQREQRAQHDQHRDPNADPLSHRFDPLLDRGGRRLEHQLADHAAVVRHVFLGDQARGVAGAGCDFALVVREHAARLGEQGRAHDLAIGLQLLEDPLGAFYVLEDQRRCTVLGDRRRQRFIAGVRRTQHAVTVALDHQPHAGEAAEDQHR
jgi:hypothetical protein